MAFRMKISSLIQKRWLLLPAFLLPLAVYLFAAFYQIKLPGPYYDEFIFLIDSLKLAGQEGDVPLHSQFFNIKIGERQLPIMRKTFYMGPGKTYLFAAIFSFLPPSVSTVRYTTAVLGLLSIIFTYLFAKRCFGGPVAFLTVLFLTTDPTFVILSRTDHGPMVMMMLCKMGALFFLLKWWEEEKLWPLLVGMFLIGFGLLGKANFIHFIIALLIASSVLLRKRLLKRLINIQIIPALLCFIIGALPFFLFHATHIKELFQVWISGPTRTADPRLFHPIGNIFRVLKLAYLTFNGSFEQEWILGKVSFKLSIPYLLGLSGLLYLIEIIPRKRPPILTSKRFNFIIIISLLLFLSMVFTPHARNAWHFFIAYPFPYIFCSVVPAAFLKQLSEKKSRLNKIIQSTIIALIAITILGNLRGLYIFHREFAADRVTTEWSAQNYALADYLRQNHDKVIVCMDWGFYCNLAFLLRGETALKDRWGDFSGAGSRPRRRLAKYFKRENYLYLFHSPRFTIFKRPRELFEEALEEYDYRAIKVKSFYNSDGREICELIKVAPFS